MNTPTDPTDSLPDGIDLDLLKELEQQTHETVRRLREQDRFEIQVGVELAPANSSDRTPAITGTSRDISTGGCLLEFPHPPGVGDIYRLSFDAPNLSLPVVFARCLRCRFVREGLFEAGFRFFADLPIDLNRARGRDGGLID